MALDDRYTITLLHLNGNIKDESGKTWAYSSPLFSSDIKKFGTSSAQFNGSSSIGIDVMPDFLFGSGDFTVDYWEYTTSLLNWGSHLGFSSPNPSKMLIGYTQGSFGNNLYFYASSNGATSYNIANQVWMGYAVYNQWTHRATVRKGNTMYFFANGVLQNNCNVGNAAIGDPNPMIYLGSMIGYLDEVRISKGIARWTSNFIPPTKAYYCKRALMLNNDTAYKHNGTIWVPVNSSWSTLTSQEKEAKFLSDGMDILPGGQAFSDFGNGTLLEYTEPIESAPLMSVKAIPTKKLILAKSDIGINSVQYIDQLKITDAVGTGDVRIIVSVDHGITWKTFDGISWQTVDISNADNVFTSGMTATIIDSITKDKWTELIGQDPQVIRFGYAISENALADKLDFTVDMKGMWFEGLPGTDYRAAYANKTTLVVQLLSSGDYKINY